MGRDRGRGRGRQKDVEKESKMDRNAQVREAGEGGGRLGTDCKQIFIC